jgi:hypothetical protein
VGRFDHQQRVGPSERPVWFGIRAPSFGRPFKQRCDPVLHTQSREMGTMTHNAMTGTGRPPAPMPDTLRLSGDFQSPAVFAENDRSIRKAGGMTVRGLKSDQPKREE